MKKVILIIARVLTAVILLQTLYFKFSGAPESVYIFSTIGMEPWGRYLIGCMELIAGVMLLLPRTYVLGAALSVGIISGAIFFHLTSLGIVIEDPSNGIESDGGMVFYMAIAVFVLSSLIVILDWEKLKQILPFKLPF